MNTRQSNVSGRNKRSGWGGNRNSFVNKEERNAKCEYCGSLNDIQVHHIIPVGEFEEWEKEDRDHPSNLISLCSKHHLEIGHNGCFKKINKDVRNDCRMNRKKKKAYQYIHTPERIERMRVIEANASFGSEADRKNKIRSLRTLATNNANVYEGRNAANAADKLECELVSEIHVRLRNDAAKKQEHDAAQARENKLREECATRTANEQKQAAQAASKRRTAEYASFKKEYDAKKQTRTDDWVNPSKVVNQNIPFESVLPGKEISDKQLVWIIVCVAVMILICAFAAESKTTQKNYSAQSATSAPTRTYTVADLPVAIDLCGQDIKSCQQSLHSAGYDIGASGADGIIGEKTFAAIIQCQIDGKCSMTSDIANKIIADISSAYSACMRTHSKRYCTTGH